MICITNGTYAFKCYLLPSRLMGVVKSYGVFDRKNLSTLFSDRDQRPLGIVPCKLFTSLAGFSSQYQKVIVSPPSTVSTDPVM